MDVKERIQQKAEELFYKYGIRSITMDEIASQLGISKKTIYQFFEDKDELVKNIFTSYMSENKARCLQDKAKAENAIHEIFLDLDMMDTLLQTMNPNILYDLEKYHPESFKKFVEYKNEFLYKLIQQNLQRGIKEELYRPDINIDMLTRFRLGTIMMSVNADIFPRNKFNYIQVEENIILHFLYGVASLKGIKLIQKYSQLKHQKNSISV